MYRYQPAPAGTALGIGRASCGRGATVMTRIRTNQGMQRRRCSGASAGGRGRRPCRACARRVDRRDRAHAAPSAAAELDRPRAGRRRRRPVEIRLARSAESPAISRPAAAQPAVQRRGAVADLADLDVLVRRVGQVRVARAEVQRRDAQRREPGHVGPAQLADRRCADGGEELLRRRRGQPGQRARRRVGRARRRTRRTPRAGAPAPRSSVRSGANRKLTSTSHASGITLPATPPVIRTALSPSRYVAAVDRHRPRPGRRRAGAAPRPARGSR